MLRALLVSGGLAALKVRATDAARGYALGLVATTVLVIFSLVALAFLAAAAVIYLSSVYGAVIACLIMAGISFMIGLLGWLVLRAMRSKPRLVAPPPAASLSDELSRVVASGGVTTLAALALVGYALGRSVREK